MNDLFGFPTSVQLAEQGMATATEHADTVAPGWSERAFDLVCQFACIRHEFLGEDVRRWAHETQDLDLPPKACAWGAVMVRAARERIIVKAGYRMTRIPPQHAKPAVLWSSLVIPKRDVA